MSTRLRLLRDDELPAYREVAERGYADSIASHGGMPRALAEAKARRDFDALWPDGRPAPKQWVYAVEERGARVGYLWLAQRENQGREVMWIYDIELGEEFRGRGLGRKAMLLAEAETRTRGLARLELNVFGGNDVARNLYRSLGYEENAVLMGKDIV